MDKQRITFTVNGEFREVVVPPDRLLLKVLREDLGLTGTKQGCDGGECGTCTVLMDGRATMSCLLPVFRAQGRDIVTIEGLARGGELHPLQEAFIAKGAVQCGFCTPGMILEAAALLGGNPHPSREDVVRRLSRHLCRCTGYVKVIDAVLYGAHLMGGGEQEALRRGDSLIGSDVLRLDGREKVTGEAKYAADLFMPGMLHAKILRSPHHHALIKNIDVLGARELAGVVSVFTGADFPTPGLATQRQVVGRLGRHLMALDRVRYVGDAVAVVVAEKEDVLGEALARIQVDYEPLPSVFDPRESMKPEAPQLHEDGNFDYEQRVIYGDGKKGFALADVIVENNYQTPYQEHAYLEPEAVLAYISEEGRLVVQAPLQFPHVTRNAIAVLLELDLSQVQIIPTMMGGGFGGKIENYTALVTAFLVHRTHKPVKLVYSRADSLLSTTKRHPFYIRYRTGATRDGKLMAIEADIIANSGHHPSTYSPGGVLTLAASHATGPYEVPNVHTVVAGYCTNGPKSGALRGFSGPQLAFATEQQMDILAHQLGLDPLEIRLRNAFDEGSVCSTGQVLENVGARKTLEAIKPYYEEARQRIAQEWRADIRVGLGLACTWRAYGGQTNQSVDAFVQLHPEGRVEILSGAVELGQGTATTMIQIAAAALGAPMERFTFTGGYPDLTPSSLSTSGQKTTLLSGKAVEQAALALKRALLPVAAEALEEKPEKVKIEDGYAFSVADPTQRLSLERLAALCQGKGVPLKHMGSTGPRIFQALDRERGQGTVSHLYAYATQLAEVEVNVESGQIRVRRVVHAGDAGKVLNPLGLVGQVEGGLLMGLGFALRENYRPGMKSFKEYSIPTTQDVPEIVSVFIEEPTSVGPFGAKGAGEMSTVPTAAAVANAVADALGVRFFQLPITPAMIKSAVRRE
ncbi:MAG: molybdopterin-dependent oxidoreductase [Chloroflexi bacterium]|nr:molybdopterin-dependent oxidoreductase [Chloroflexota bacterium]